MNWYDTGNKYITGLYIFNIENNAFRAIVLLYGNHYELKHRGVFFVSQDTL